MSPRRCQRCKLILVTPDYYCTDCYSIVVEELKNHPLLKSPTEKYLDKIHGVQTTQTRNTTQKM